MAAKKPTKTKDAWANYRWQSQAVRAGQYPSPEGEHSDPIYLTSSYVFENAAQAARRFASEEKGNVYSRYTNPSVQTLEERMALLENAPAAVATASGMAAILSTCMSLLSAGDHILCSRAVFGATISLLNHYMVKFGVAVDYVDGTEIEDWQAMLRPETKILFLESPSNPLATIYDISALAALAKSHKALLVVDNCFCTPALQRPIDLGADIVIHSATKYLDGQGRCMGGIVLGNCEHMDAVRTFLRTAGPCLSPFNAWVIIGGLETLAIRMRAHSENAMEIAKRLQTNAGVKRVYYSGLSDHPGHDLAAKQQKAFGGVLAFELSGGKREAWAVIDRVRMLSLTANLGDTKSTIIHPASTTHSRLSDEDRAKAGISDGMIRVSVGLEDVEDIYEDLHAALTG